MKQNCVDQFLNCICCSAVSAVTLLFSYEDFFKGIKVESLEQLCVINIIYAATRHTEKQLEIKLREPLRY